MASRQEEKERRREERIEREKAEAAAAQRKRLIRIVAAVVVAAVAVVAVVLLTGGGSKDKAGPKPAVAIPDRKITDLEDAAKAASCVLTNPPIEGSNHVSTKVTYKTNPPTSGDHVPPGQQASDGNYAGVRSPPKERYVHSLEHGRIVIHYKPGLAQPRLRQLETLWAEDSKTEFGLDSIGGGYTLLMQNNTKMTHEVAATAWGHLLACKTFNDKAFDAIRAFRQSYVLQAPEKVTEPE